MAPDACVSSVLAGLCWCALGLCGVEVSPVRMALWAWLGPWLAGTWAGMAWLEGAASCAASAIMCHVVVGRRRRDRVGGKSGWERGALHDPIVYNDS